jgi:threonine/homoserine/homoserine lactone efflux protein
MNDFLSAAAVFAALAAVLVITPGADTILVLRTAMRSGRRAGIVTSTGVVTGPVVWGVAAGTGLAFVLQSNVWLYRAIILAGAGYLLYLAIESFRSAFATKPVGFAVIVADRSNGAGVYKLYSRGLLTNLLNPKIGIFYLSVIPGLLPPGSSSALFGFTMGCIQACLGLLFLTAVSSADEVFRRFFARPRSAMILELCAGAALLAFCGYAVSSAFGH